MKNEFQSFMGGTSGRRGQNDPRITRESPANHPRITRVWKVIGTIFLLFTLGIGQMWGAEIFAYTLTGAGADGTTYTATGGSAKCLKAMASGGSNEITIGTQTFYKFNSSSAWQFTLASGNFAVGDVISFTCACGTSAKSGKGVKINNSISVTGDFPASTANTITYTVTASDGIAGENKFSLYRNDSDIKFGTVSVTRSSGDTPVCPSGLTISSKDNKTAFTEGDAIELTASLTAGNGTITYQWYKGSVASGNAISGATAAKYEKSNCTTADAGDYFCVASKDDCSDAVNASAFAITVAADTKCFNMPAITSQPSDLAHVSVTGGTLSDVSTAKAVGMNANGLKLDGNSVYLKVSLASASIVEGTKITVAWKGASDGAGLALVNENLEHQVINESSIAATGSVSHTFTAVEAANYADEFIIHRNASGKSLYVNAITVEDCGAAVVKHTITLNYNDGVTPNGSMQVVDGKAATQPADPERGKYTFLGWNNGASAYNWATPVTADLTLTAQWQTPWVISFDADGGSAVDDITVKHNTKAEKPADPTKASHDFNGWYIGETDNAFDWDANVTTNYSLKAHWLELVAKYDIEYYDGETKIGTEEQVRVDQHPTAAGIETDKPLYSFVGWYSDPELNTPVTLSSVVPAAGLKLYGKWTKVYGNNVDFEAYIHANNSEKDDVDKAEAYVLSQNYALSTKTGTTFDANSSTNNGAYEGLKIKNSGTVLSWNVAAGKVVEFKAGVMVANGSLSINGGAATTIDGGTTGTGDNFKIHYFYSAAEALYEFTTSNGSAEVVKAITMRDPYQVLFDDNGADNPVAPQYAYPSVTLPSATKGTESFLGWFDDPTDGNKIGDAGASYTPTAAAVTLYAHWEAISTDNTLSDLQVGGVTVDGFSPTVHTYYVVLPYGTAVENIPAISATANSAKAKQVAIQQAVWAGDPYNCYRAQANVQAEDESWGYYDVRFSFAPKDGVSLIKVATTGGSNKTVTGAYAGDGDVNLSSSKKMDNGKYIGFTLDGTTLQAGDRINVHTSQAANTGGSHIIFYDNMTDKNELYETGEIGGTGNNIFTINAAMVGATTAYVYRSNADAAHQWNGYVDYIEVTRAMDPVLTAITIDGRDGVVDALVDNKFNVTIPHEAVLSSLTVVPTIIRNAAHATTPEAVISNEGAWIEGANTYRVMDKDGDYTDYTITLTRDVLKHTVSFNVHGGSAVASELVVDGENLAAAPAAPEKEDYLFQGWAETDGGAIVDVTSFTISADKEFHAVWASDGGIKLLNGSAVNTTNFITGVTADETVEFKGNEVNYAKFSGTCSGVSSVKDLTRVIAYNATTNKTKIQISAHNNSTSARNILVKGLVEGASEAVDLATVALGNKEDKVSDWIEFDNAANRTIYIMVSSSAGDVYFTQVKVIESGETPMKQAGEAGYSLNFNKGRFFGLANTDLAFEGLNARLSGDYTALNSGYAKLNATSMSFTVADPMLLKVTANNRTYYVTKGAAGTDNETTKAGVSEFELTAGTWYITAGASEVQISNIAFELPKCAEPAFNALANSDICEGASYEALDGTATVADAGVPTYQWYNADGDEAIDGATAAKFTPTADGSYYVIATNHLADHSDNAKQSATVTVTTFASAAITAAPSNVRKSVGAEVTLTVVATGKDLHYAWKECATIDGTYTDVAGAADAASLDITVGAGVKYYKVVVSSACGEPVEAISKVEEWVEVAQVNVTTSTVWEWNNAVEAADESSVAESGAAIQGDPNTYTVLANVEYIHMDDDFMSNALVGKAGLIAWRSSSYKAFQGSGDAMLKFHTTVAGKVRILTSSSNKNKDTEIKINDYSKVFQTTGGGRSAAIETEWVEVPADADVVIGAGASQSLRIYRIEFLAVAHRRTSGYNAGDLGTVCLEDATVIEGATLYELAGLEEHGYLAFDEIQSGELEAGKPYLFEVTNPSQISFYKPVGAAHSDEEIATNGMIGTFNGQDLVPGDGNFYYFSGRHIWRVNDFTVAKIAIPANRCYVDMDALQNAAPAAAPAPGRRRVTMGGVNAPAVATGMENVQGDDAQSTKVLINGALYIIRGEKMYDATGRLVK